MKLPTLFAVAAAVALSACTSSSKSSGNAARSKFESRTEISMPASVPDWEFAYVQIGETYGEYYRFRCAPEVFSDVTAKLALKPGALDVYSCTDPIEWGRCEVEGNPNDPSWWVRPTNRSQQVYHKQDYSDIAARSVMACWYDAGSGLAYLSVDFWD